MQSAFVLERKRKTDIYGIQLLMVKLSSAVPRKLLRLPITELRIDRVTLLIVTYPVNNNALMFLLIARQTLNLSSSIVVISYHFTVRISHRLHPVPAVIGSTIDISPNNQYEFILISSTKTMYHPVLDFSSNLLYCCLIQRVAQHLYHKYHRGSDLLQNRSSYQIISASTFPFLFS